MTGDGGNAYLLLNLRTQVVTFKSTGFWDRVTVPKLFPVAETALLLCDLWDHHWCKAATKRAAAIAERANRVVAAARANGVQVIHCPSDTMDFYAYTPQRRRVADIPTVEPPDPIDLPIPPPLPIDDSDGGCDDGGCETGHPWTRQHPAIEIGEDDMVSDDGGEVYSFMRGAGIENLVVIGIHTNMCVLDRSFAIKQMTKWGIPCVLVRDLTDTMYKPGRAPYVSHDRGTELVVDHIERYWCPSILSRDLLNTHPR